MPKFTIKNFLFGLFTLLVFAACASPQHQALRKVDVGMDKADVLDKVGSPTRKARVLGQDRWTYDADGSSGADTTYIFFQDGKVTYVGGAEEPADAPVKQKSAVTKSSNFKPIGE